MSKTLKTKTLSDPVKATVKAKSVPYQVLDTQIEIDKAVKSGEIEEKEIKLLEKELAKPYSKRNKSLLSKYSYRDTSSVDGYPDLGRGGYDVHAIALDDGTIEVPKRPEPYFIEILLKIDGNNYSYKFPISHHQLGDGEVVYKLDGYDKYVRKNGDILDHLSDEVTPYDILHNLRFGDKSLAAEFRETKNGKSFYNLTFPGFHVKFTQLDTKPEGKEDRPTMDTFIVINIHDEIEIEGNNDEAKRVLNVASATGVDAGDTPVINANDIDVYKVIVGDRRSKNTWLWR